MMKKSKILASILAIALTLGLTGCGSEATIIMNEDGSIKAFTEEEIPEGLYVKSGDNYYSLLNADPGEGSDEEDASNYQWFTEYDQLIPEMTEKDKLILYSEGEVPETFTFYKMTDFGYTVGIKFTQDNVTKKLTFPSGAGGYCPYSPVGDYILETTFGGSVSNVSIKEVNGKEFRETMLTTDGFMKGLTKDAMYKFWYYQGTVYKSVNIKADTHVFIEDYELSTGSYVELKDKTFEVNLPASIENGYWLIDGYGLFKYSGPETDLILDGNEEDLISGDEDSAIEGNTEDMETSETSESQEETPEVSE